VSVTVFIDGAVGTTGLEIRERLAGRQDLSLIMLDPERRKEDAARREALNEADIAILCLPDDAARAAVAMIDNPHTRVIDASSAHRVADGWTYGFPELGYDVGSAMRVSNPGCWPSGFLAFVAPLVRSGLVPADWSFVYSGASGYSGGGSAMITEFQNGAADTAYRAYGLGLSHKHLPEMRIHSGLSSPPIFLPAVAATHRGMLGEVGLAIGVLPRRPDAAAIRAVLTGAYGTDGVISLAPACDEAAVRIEEDAGTDRMTLRVFANEASGQARLIATYDNLGKGAAGAAVQNLNIMAGADPHEGLVL
jgi:N-acetyl-gamma-glutamyl-phosphate reductase